MGLPAEKAEVRVRRSASDPGSRDRTLFMLQLVLPAVLTLVAFQIIPIGIGIVNSMHRKRVWEMTPKWVGLEYYKATLTDPHFLTVVIPNTVMFMVAAVSIEVTLGLSIAVLINRKFRLSGLVRTVLLLPLMVAPIVSALMWKWMFNDQFGIVNVVIKALGATPVPWLTGRWTGFFPIIVAEVWTNTPWFIVILFAALQGLPKDPHEAALLDGASGWQIFRYVTLPLLFPVLAVTLILRSFDVFRAFDVVWALTQGDPGRSTEVFSVYAYKEAFSFQKPGEGSAVAMVGAMVQMFLGVLFYRFIGRTVRAKIQ